MQSYVQAQHIVKQLARGYCTWDMLLPELLQLLT